jgi:SPP1 family predicted phage head-tail adaptor
MKPYNPGRMDRRITVQSFTTTQNAIGEPEKTWTALYTDISAEVAQVGGREYFSADQRVAEADCRFYIRYRGDITEQMRIVYDGKTYDIKHIREIGRRERLEILAKAEAI